VPNLNKTKQCPVADPILCWKKMERKDGKMEKDGKR